MTVSKHNSLGIDIPDTQVFQHRTIGEQVRHARLFGVTPDMVVSEMAYDDDGDDAVDPYGNPRTDRIDLLREGLLSPGSVPPSQQTAETTTEQTQLQNNQTVD